MENMLKRRWSTKVLRYLSTGVYQPAEIIKREPLLSPTVLSERLRTMLRYGLVARFPHAPPSDVIEYRLTNFGRRILDMLNGIEQLDLELQRNPSLDPRFDDRQRTKIADFISISASQNHSTSILQPGDNTATG